MTYTVDFVDYGVYYLRDTEYGDHLGRIDLFKEVTDKLSDEEIDALLSEFLAKLLKKMEEAGKP